MTQHHKNKLKTKKEFDPLDDERGQSQAGWDAFRLKFDRYGWDVFAILALAISLITFLGLVGLTAGRVLQGWVEFLLNWLGWGSYFFVCILVLLGLFALRRRSTHATHFPLGKLLGLEGLAFLFITFLSMTNGHSLARAEQGMDGGFIGWGLSEVFLQVFPAPFAAIVVGFFSLLLFLHITGFISFLKRQLKVWVEKVRNEPDIDIDFSQNATKSSIGGYLQQRKSNLGIEDELPEAFDEPSTPSSRLHRSEHLPPLGLLNNDQVVPFGEADIHQTSLLIEKTLVDLGVPARVVGIRSGPTVTQFAVEPGYLERGSSEGEPVRHKVRVSQISALSRDLALALSAERLRIEAPVPGKSFVGIEVPNPKSTNVGLRSILESMEFNKGTSSLGIALGKDVTGKPVVADLARMPHLLIAGTTGSGKSVCIAALTLCLVMNNSPDELRLVMLDPKMVELMRFNGLRHLLGKVETEPERILGVLRWALQEMDRRYRLLESARARNIDTYNRKMGRNKSALLPKIVILIDELADLMLTAPDQTEHNLVRLAQMARATGIHLVLATQRPSTDVVTGLIKANFPARISFNVASSIDSRVILDETGAETLLGRGDMLFLNPEFGKPVRAQGVIVDDAEIENIIRFWRESYHLEPEPAPWEETLQSEKEEETDRLVDEAIRIVRKTQRASASLLQRRLRIGYPRAARLIDQLEELGVVGPSQGGGRERDVLLGTADDDIDQSTTIHQDENESQEEKK